MNERDIELSMKGSFEGMPADFAGFEQIYHTRLRPELAAMEEGRLRAASTAKRGYVVGVLIALAGAGIGFLGFNEPALAIFGVIAGIGASTFMGANLRAIGAKAKSMMVVPVAGELGLNFVEMPGPQSSIHDFRTVGLVPGWDREGYEDRITGQRNGVDFEFFEAHLEERRTTRDSQGRTKTRWVTVFRGQCLRFKFHKTFLGRTLVTRDAGFFNRFGGGRGMEIAKLEDPVFEKAFSVFTTDQVESRFILTPDFMQRLVDLEEAFHGGKLRCAFEGGEILIAVQGGNLFEPGSLFTPLDNPARVRDLLNDFAAVFHLIDAASDPALVER